MAAWTDLVATGEGITGKSWFVGNAPGSSTGTDLCSAKVISSLSGVQGICPESPALKGGYLMAGAAYGAHINRIRDLGNDPKTNEPIVAAEEPDVVEGHHLWRPAGHQYPADPCSRAGRRRQVRDDHSRVPTHL